MISNEALINKLQTARRAKFEAGVELNPLLKLLLWTLNRPWCACC